MMRAVYFGISTKALQMKYEQTCNRGEKIVPQQPPYVRSKRRFARHFVFSHFFIAVTTFKYILMKLLVAQSKNIDSNRQRKEENVRAFHTAMLTCGKSYEFTNLCLKCPRYKIVSEVLCKVKYYVFYA